MCSPCTKAKRLASFKAKQAETLSLFRNYADAKSWEKLHRHHFDWWLGMRARDGKLVMAGYNMVYPLDPFGKLTQLRKKYRCSWVN